MWVSGGWVSTLKLYVKLSMYLHCPREKVHSFDEIYIKVNCM